MKRYPATIRERGFTLIELLIAVFIFAIVVSSVYGSYRATFNVVHGSESRLKIANSARIVLERLSEDLSSLVTGPGGLFGGEMLELSGNRGDSLSFVSSAHLVLSKTDTLTGQAFIQYQAELDEETGLLDLYRSDMALLPGVDTDSGKVQKHLLCRGLQEVRFTYLDRDGSESEDWPLKEVGLPSGGSAPGASPFPSLVYVELKFAESVESDSSSVFKTAVALP